MKQEAPNVLICPNSTEMPIEVDPTGLVDLAALNKELRKIRMNIEKQFSKKISKLKMQKNVHKYQF